MSRQPYTLEEITNKLRDADVELARGHHPARFAEEARTAARMRARELGLLIELSASILLERQPGLNPTALGLGSKCSCAHAAPFDVVGSGCSSVDSSSADWAPADCLHVGLDVIEDALCNWQKELGHR